MGYRSGAVIIAGLLLCNAVLAYPGMGTGKSSVRSFYKKSTHKSRAIGEASNRNLLQLEAAKGSRLGVQSVVQTLSTNEACNAPQPTCDPYTMFRTHDGSCNNLANPTWGTPFTPLVRIAPADYADGVNEPRGGRASTLPNPRAISTAIHSDLISPDSALTNMVPQVGQFVDHDLSFAPEDDRKCCSLGISHPDCFDIPIPSTDKFYARVNQTCLDFTRSTPYCFPGATGIREQMNSITAFLDASQVYGSDSHRGNYLREGSGGRLRANSGLSNFLPSVHAIESEINEEIEIMGEYAAGDERVNEMPGLTTLHTLMFREHNRIANEMARMNPASSDEALFQMARRLLIAQWQQIVYGEYLPVILGPQTMARYGLTVTPGQFTQYDGNVDPTIIQPFAAAAYRFGHTLINGLIQMIKDSQTILTYRIRDGFFDTSLITALNGQGYDLILNGLIQQNAQVYDRFVTEDLTNFLLREPHDSFGSDLIARNLQRGRDHGVPSYSVFRKVCSLPALTTWANRPAEIPADNWNRLSSLYQTPQDIDLFTAGLSETPVSGGVSGTIFNCIKGIQFQRTKFGDRFFFTHQGQAGSFTPDQLAEINKRSLGDVICQNSVIKRTPTNAFRPASPSNPWLACDDPSRVLDVGKFMGD